MTLSRFVASLSQPCIPVHARDVHVLHSPVQFYNTLLVCPLWAWYHRDYLHRDQDMIRRAKRRIFLSSLYIGTSEAHLVSTAFCVVAEISHRGSCKAFVTRSP